MSTTICKFGDVVLVRYLYTDQSGSKQRPVVLVSSNFYNENLPDAVLMPITSRVYDPLRPGEIPVVEWNAAGLLKPSVIKPVFSTMAKVLIHKKIGELQTVDCDAIQTVLFQLLG